MSGCQDPFCKLRTQRGRQGPIGTTRLVGDTENTGQVEVMYDNTWAKVCRHQEVLMNLLAAQVVCMELGMDAGYVTTSDPPVGPVDEPQHSWLRSVSCSLLDVSLAGCQHHPWKLELCPVEHILAVNCFDIDDDQGIVCNSNNANTINNRHDYIGYRNDYSFEDYYTSNNNQLYCTCSDNNTIGKHYRSNTNNKSTKHTGNDYNSSDINTFNRICSKTSSSTKYCNHRIIYINANHNHGYNYCNNNSTKFRRDNNTACTSWTVWFNRDSPEGRHDSETLTDLQTENPGQICTEPVGIQARVSGSRMGALLTGELFKSFSPTQGFDCMNSEQDDGSCQDYETQHKGFWISWTLNGTIAVGRDDDITPFMQLSDPDPLPIRFVAFATAHGSYGSFEICDEMRTDGVGLKAIAQPNMAFRLSPDHGWSDSGVIRELARLAFGRVGWRSAESAGVRLRQPNVLKISKHSALDGGSEMGRLVFGWCSARSASARLVFGIE
ncbi:CILP2 [Branchiostoma lanceolatum]|uniref:CILP2 protein n=1 Tax=Branchiostoma lanceolatum TaxID=7740 RepID=A0A8J9YK49_BRALA|nr:CILP2 [Branchiostoma lanceolatum]